jgi:hypothetical protein
MREFISQVGQKDSPGVSGLSSPQTGSDVSSSDILSLPVKQCSMWCRSEHVSQSRRMNLGAEAIELEEVHDERPPLVGVDVVPVAWRENGLVDVCSNDPNLNRSRVVLGIADFRDARHGTFQLNRAFRHPRRQDNFRNDFSQSRSYELVTDMFKTHDIFVPGHRITTSGKGETIDLRHKIDRWDTQNALPFTAEILNRV